MVHDSVVHPHHHAGHGGHYGSDGEGGRDHPVHVHADERGHRPVLRGGAHGLAEFRLLDEKLQSRHEAYGNDEDEYLQTVHVGAEKLETPEFEQIGKRLVPRSLDDLNVVLQEQAHPYRADERGEPGRIAKRSISYALKRYAVRRAIDHRNEEDEDDAQREARLRETHGPQHRQDGDAHVRAYHVDFAVGEIDELQNAVDERVAQGDQGVHGPHDEAVYQLLRKHREIFTRLRDEKERGGPRLPSHDTAWLPLP